ncbi:MAG: hypothetical protein SVJ22_10765 [Halobacteriota archaeon]|nr:hypothetical protein [Halobacteriota archaeon]
MLKRKTILKDSKKAAMLFKEEGNLFTEKKMELLALGNSSFCKALENGCKFDQVGEMKEKQSFIPKQRCILEMQPLLIENVVLHVRQTGHLQNCCK